MARSKNPRRLVTVSQAADYVMVHPATIRRRIASGEITGYRLGSRVIRVDLDELGQLLKRTGAGAA